MVWAEHQLRFPVLLFSSCVECQNVKQLQFHRARFIWSSGHSATADSTPLLVRIRGRNPSRAIPGDCAALLIPLSQTKHTTSVRTLLPVINPTVIRNVVLLLHTQRYLRVFWFQLWLLSLLRDVFSAVGKSALEQQQTAVNSAVFVLSVHSAGLPCLVEGPLLCPPLWEKL